MYHSSKIKMTMNTKLSELLHGFQRAYAVFAAATGLTCVRVFMCVSNVGESVIKQSVTAVAVLSHAAADRHKQAHTSTCTCTHLQTHRFGAVALPSTNSSHLARPIRAQCGVVDGHLWKHLSTIIYPGLKRNSTEKHLLPILMPAINKTTAFPVSFHPPVQHLCFYFPISRSKGVYLTSGL